MDSVTDTSDSVSDSLQAVLTINRFPQDQGPSHLKTTATVVGSPELVTVTDRDLSQDEQTVVLDTLALIQTLQHMEGTGADLGALFAQLTDAVFIGFEGYCRGVIDGPKALEYLALAGDSIESLMKLYERDPLAESRPTYGVE